jgi:hypothetical protein
MLKNQRSYGDKCGVGFNKKSMTKGERKREKDEEARKEEAISFHVL